MTSPNTLPTRVAHTFSLSKTSEQVYNFQLHCSANHSSTLKRWSRSYRAFPIRSHYLKADDKILEFQLFPLTWPAGSLKPEGDGTGSAWSAPPWGCALYSGRR
ncbi:sentrin-specific protease 8 [Trichinella spiralis]|uniref:sentrin-specific protease 8 n=1 Tax=Trichinella spiralis TaxID=6334 RepID=UPI0001EFCD51|nr:sentrin-specific protease 8 [Trichinella spiralis]